MELEQDKKVVSQKILQIFTQQKRLSGVVAFLNFIKKKQNLGDFYSFFKKHHSYLSPKKIPSGVLFHGSNKLITVLRPNASMRRCGTLEQEKVVYATNDPNYAIFLAILNLKNGIASVNATTRDTKLFVDLDFVNGPSKFKDGYIHIIAASDFKKTKNREYISHKEINVLFSIPVAPKDITVPIHIQTEP